MQVSSGDIAWTREADGGSAAHLLLAAVALDGKGKPVAKSIRDVNAKLPAEVSLSSIPFTPLEVELQPPPSAVRVRFVVRDQANGRLGTFEVSLPVP